MSEVSKALENVQLALRIERTLPDQVFTEGWRHFRFFDSGWMTDQSFIKTVQSLMEIEGCDEAR